MDTSGHVAMDNGNQPSAGGIDDKTKIGMCDGGTRAQIRLGDR